MTFVKRIYLLLVLHFAFSPLVFSQILPIDSSTKKIVYEDIIITDSITTNQLFENASLWMKKNFKNKNFISTYNLSEGSLESKGRFLVYTKGAISKEIHGAIRFNVKIDIKQNKYRYTFTNFVFEYYYQNREYKYVPTGKEKSLEETKFPGWQRVWQKHKYTTAKIVNDYIADLKTSMEKKNNILPSPTVKKKLEW